MASLFFLSGPRPETKAEAKPVESRVERLQVVKVDQATGADVYLHCRTEEGLKVVLQATGHRPYFYAKSGPKHPDVTGVEEGYTSIVDGSPLKRFYVSRPGVVSDLRSLFEDPHEADVPYTQRVLVDMPLNGVIEAPVGGLLTKVDMRDIKSVEVRKWSTKREAGLDIETGPGAVDSMDDPHSPVWIVGLFVSESEVHCWLWHPVEVLPQGFTFQFKGGDKRTIVPILHQFKSERAMMQDFLRWLRSPETVDVFGTWYGEEFDIPYLIKRAATLGISSYEWGLGRTDSWSATVAGVQHVDILAVHRKTSQSVLKDDKLQTVARELCGMELEKVPGEIERQWKEDLGALVRYNLWDCEATWRINKKKDYTGWAMRYAMFAGVDNAVDVTSASIVWDALCMRWAGQRKLALPMKPPSAVGGSKWRKGRKKEKGFTGGKVRDPIVGIHPNVAVVDFKAMYPIIMIGANLSYETYCNAVDCARPHVTVPDVGHRFHTDVQGMIPSINEDLFVLRNSYEKEMKAATDKAVKDYWTDMRKPIKEAQNAGFGVQGYKGFRLYRKEVSESITAYGRKLGTSVCSFLESIGYTVIYSDTDSAMFKLPVSEPEDVLALMKDLVPRINEHVRGLARGWGMVSPDRLDVDFEKFYLRYLQGRKKDSEDGAKKRYAGLVTIKDWKPITPFVEVKGFETKRSETSKVTKELQDRIIDMILKEQARPDDVWGHVQKVYLAVRSGKHRAVDCARAPKIGMDLDDYKLRGDMVKAAEFSMSFLDKKFRVGDRVHIVPVVRGRWKTDIIGLEADDEVPQGYVPNWQELADSMVKEKVGTFLDLVGMRGREQALGMRALEDWF